MEGYTEPVRPVPREGYVDPAVVIGSLRQIEEPNKRPNDVYALGCPCLCVPKTKFVTQAPMWGGAAIIGLGCKD